MRNVFVYITTNIITLIRQLPTRFYREWSQVKLEENYRYIKNYIQSIALYDSEIWTIIEGTIKSI